MESSNNIRVTEVRLVSNSTIEVKMDISGEVKNYFKSNSFTTEYSCELLSIPYGVAVIPFLCNILPIAWLTDSQIECDELDSDFFECIPQFKEGYRKMYPTLDFKGHLTCRKVSCSSSENKHLQDKSLMFFSGGVDAFATLFAHMEEHPSLFILLGSDIRMNNIEGWSNVSRQLANTASAYHLPTLQCKSNFREFINESLLTQMVNKLGIVGGWWHEFQHGIGLLGHAAPLAWKYGYTKIYIASTFTIRDYGRVTCASDPTIDNYVQFAGARVFHDQYEFNRQQKIRHIVDFCKRNNTSAFLRVCWQGDKGVNCCKCEKCYRTIVGLSAEGEDAHQWGFDDFDLNQIKNELKYNMELPTHVIPFWQDIQDRIKETPIGTNQVEWLRDYNINNLNDNYYKRMLKFLKRIKRYIKRQLNKKR